MFSAARCFEEFREQLVASDVLEHLREGLIGEGVVFDGPFGPKSLLYADYTASGRALRQIE